MARGEGRSGFWKTRLTAEGHWSRRELHSIRGKKSNVKKNHYCCFVCRIFLVHVLEGYGEEDPEAVISLSEAYRVRKEFEKVWGR